MTPITPKAKIVAAAWHTAKFDLTDNACGIEPTFREFPWDDKFLDALVGGQDFAIWIPKGELANAVVMDGHEPPRIRIGDLTDENDEIVAVGYSGADVDGYLVIHYAIRED